MNRKKIIMGRSGQSTIEFLLCFIYSFGIIFVFFNVAYNITNGHLVHYATFMASRAYLVSDDNSNTARAGDETARAVANEVFEKFRINSFIPDNGGRLVINSPEDGPNVFVGLFYKYKTKFSTVPMIGGQIDLNMASESFLGRIPSRAECLSRICKAMELPNGGGCPDYFATFYDDGC
ncbi:MAG TPA: hypothetical protein VI754_08375 [Bacteriovoracaceae bacterium]|nr:hypothetical protein [Bacteriovoracaceae bacterium]